MAVRIGRVVSVPDTALSGVYITKCAYPALFHSSHSIGNLRPPL